MSKMFKRVLLRHTHAQQWNGWRVDGARPSLQDPVNLAIPQSAYYDFVSLTFAWVRKLSEGRERKKLKQNISTALIIRQSYDNVRHMQGIVLMNCWSTHPCEVLVLVHHWQQRLLDSHRQTWEWQRQRHMAGMAGNGGQTAEIAVRLLTSGLFRTCWTFDFLQIITI
jgi:hypothetical protein